MDTQVLEFFKTFSDLSRLRLAGLIAEQSLTSEEISAQLGLRPADTHRHLAMIRRLGLLREDGEQLRLDAKALEALSRGALAGQRPVAAARSLDPAADEFDHQVVRNYSLPDGSLREIPLQKKKFQSVLRHVAQAFEPGRRYTEKEVNEALKRYHTDFATLRRGLYDEQLLERTPSGAEYWRSN